MLDLKSSEETGFQTTLTSLRILLNFSVDYSKLKRLTKNAIAIFTKKYQQKMNIHRLAEEKNE